MAQDREEKNRKARKRRAAKKAEAQNTPADTVVAGEAAAKTEEVSEPTGYVRPKPPTNHTEAVQRYESIAPHWMAAVDEDLSVTDRLEEAIRPRALANQDLSWLAYNVRDELKKQIDK